MASRAVTLPAVLSIICLMLTLSFCTSPMNPDKEGLATSGELIIRFAPAQPVSIATVSPDSADITITSFDVHCDGPDSLTYDINIDAGQSEITILELTPGLWNIEIEGENVDAVPIVSGSLFAVEISAGSAVEKSITLSPIAGSGTLQVSVSWPVNANASTAVEGTLIASDGTPSTVPFEIDTENETAWYEDAALQTGSYTILIRLIQNGIDVYSAVEAVRIYAGLVSPVTFNPALAEINDPAQDALFFLDEVGPLSFDYSIDLGPIETDVIFIFTNIGNAGALSQPAADLLNVSAQRSTGISEPSDSPDESTVPSTSLNTAPEDILALRGTPEISRFNENPFAYREETQSTEALNAASSQFSIMSDGGAGDFEGRTLLFDAYQEDVQSTCRKRIVGIDVAQGSPRSLSIWVADDCWESGEKANHVNQEMVEKIADKFLLGDEPSGVANDIYDWVTAIYGEEWGDQSDTSYIPHTNNITILIYDIDADNSTNGGVLGFFWSKDNFTTDVFSNSNERIMIYIDAVMLAQMDDTTWEPTDFWPQQIISTLVHELQHLIHFYQKTVLRSSGAGTKIWINEMVSMVTEDLLANKIGVMGPRGVPIDDIGGPGSPGTTVGRLPFYNYWHDTSLTDWPLPTAPLDDHRKSYATAYAFGAFLARNFGGAGLFKEIVQNNYTDYRSIEIALGRLGYNETFEELLRMWGAASVFSDDTYPPNALSRYNRGTFFTSNVGGLAYDLGSINLFNYDFDPGTGPVAGPLFFDTSPIGRDLPPAARSNLFYLAGAGLTYTQSWQISLPEYVMLTVVLKR